MKCVRATVQVGVRELKNRLSSYLKLVKAGQEVIVTMRGNPIAVIRSLGGANAPKSLEARLAALSARREITLPSRRLVPRLRRAKVAGRPLSDEIIADR
jgi:prevent-host-death family protein